MSVRLQLVAGAIIIVFLALILNKIRRKKFELKYGLKWIILCFIVLILDIFPQIVYAVAELIGIEIPSNMVFFFGFIFLIVLVYSLTVSVSHLSDKTKKLTQELALLRDEVEKLKK